MCQHLRDARGMTPARVKGRKKKKSAHLKCLKCSHVFYSCNIKLNRVCDICKKTDVWQNPNSDFSL